MAKALAKSEAPEFNAWERKMLGALEKRARWLKDRIDISDVNLTFDREERAAILWALDVIRKAREVEEDR